MDEHETNRARGFLAAIPGVLLSPRGFFDRLKERPRWLAPFIVASVVIFAMNLVMAPYLQEMQEHILARSTKPEIAEARRQQADRGAVGKVVAGLGSTAWILVGTLAWAVAFLVSSSVLGGESSFRKMFAVSSHCLLIDALGALVRVGLMALKGSAMVATSLAALWPTQDPLDIGYAMLGRIDLFVIWWVVAASAGVAAMGNVSFRRAVTGVVTLRAVVALVEVVMQAVIPRIFLGIP